jgi:hypothetical protein
MYGRRILLDGSLSLRELRGAFLNYLIQTSASDLLKLTMRRLWAEGASILASVHDEILLTVKPKCLKQSKALFEEALRKPQFWCLVPMFRCVSRWALVEAGGKHRSTPRRAKNEACSPFDASRFPAEAWGKF